MNVHVSFLSEKGTWLYYLTHGSLDLGIIGKKLGQGTKLEAVDGLRNKRNPLEALMCL